MNRTPQRPLLASSTRLCQSPCRCSCAPVPVGNPRSATQPCADTPVHGDHTTRRRARGGTWPPRNQGGYTVGVNNDAPVTNSAARTDAMGTGWSVCRCGGADRLQTRSNTRGRDRTQSSNPTRRRAPCTVAATVSGKPAVSMSRQAPSSGCQRSARVRVGLSAALSGPSNPAGILQGAPENPNSARQRRWLRAVRHSGVRMDRNRGNPRTIVGLLFPADCRCRPPDHRSRSRQQRRHAHRRTGAPALRRDVAPSALSRRRSHSSGLRRCGSLSHGGVPGFLWAGHPEHSGRNVVTAPNSLHARRQIDSKKPPRYTRCHRIGPLPGGSYFRNGWVCSPEYAVVVK